MTEDLNSLGDPNFRFPAEQPSGEVEHSWGVGATSAPGEVIGSDSSIEVAFSGIEGEKKLSPVQRGAEFLQKNLDSAKSFFEGMDKTEIALMVSAVAALAGVGAIAIGRPLDPEAFNAYMASGKGALYLLGSAWALAVPFIAAFRRSGNEGKDQNNNLEMGGNHAE